jgi:hypothetical protein
MKQQGFLVHPCQNVSAGSTSVDLVSFPQLLSHLHFVRMELQICQQSAQWSVWHLQSSRMTPCWAVGALFQCCANMLQVLWCSNTSPICRLTVRSGTGSWQSSLLCHSSPCVSLMEPVRMNASTAAIGVWTGQHSLANWFRAFQLRTCSPTGLPTEVGGFIGHLCPNSRLKGCNLFSHLFGGPRFEAKTEIWPLLPNSGYSDLQVACGGVMARLGQ